MSSEFTQLPLAFGSRAPRLSRSDYITSNSNRAALETADAWAMSTESRLVICGPAGSGKSHLAAIVAGSVSTEELNETHPNGLTRLENGRIEVFDNVHQVRDAKELLADIEQGESRNRRVVLVGRGQPVEWARDLRDLKTRIEAMPRICLQEPDEPLLQAVLHKLFADRQLRIDPAIVDYACPRLPRTFAAAQAFVIAVDAEVARSKAPITKFLAGNVINNLSEGLPTS